MQFHTSYGTSDGDFRRARRSTYLSGQALHYGLWPHQVATQHYTQPNQVVIDLNRMSYLDSIGIGSLLIIKECFPNAKMEINCANPAFLDILQLSRLDTFFQITVSR
ncbi:STAS domain-containing protein [Magnetofaba australis]|uniref:STAS domain-containing protein n=1 Tax=Magnetofaba australis TaxID=1472297 RepID=UPI000A19C413|nr:STAS domain-containing protein [Magnetofaba australis]